MEGSDRKTFTPEDGDLASNNHIFNIQIPQDELHEHLGGGVPKGTLCLLEGAFGSGKSAIAQRLIHGILANGFTSTVLSTELSTKDFINQMYSLGYPVAKPLLDDKLLFIPIYPLIGRMQPKGNYVDKLFNARGLFDSDFIVIDTFTTLMSNTNDPKHDALDMLSFLKRLVAMEKSIVITADPAEVGEGILTPYRSTAQIYIDIKTKYLGGSMRHMLFINRFGNAGGPVTDMVGFTIKSKIGLIIDISAV